MALLGSLGLSLLDLDALDVFDLLMSQLQELRLGDSSTVQGGDERLRRGERRDVVGGIGLSGSNLLLSIKVILDHGGEVHELVSQLELLHELVV